MKTLLIALLLAVVSIPTGAEAGANLLTWKDNSDNEQGFEIERAAGTFVQPCPATRVFTPLATTGANVVTYLDTNLVEGTAYCYRVLAFNSAGKSGFSNEAGRAVPFTVPAAPSSLQAGGGI